MQRLCACVVLVLVGVPLAQATDPSVQSSVSRHDVVYTSPSSEPWDAMPVGGGDLSAMVRFNGDLHLHLTKSDAWGFQVPPDAKPGSRFFNNVSPGHVRVDFGPEGKAAAGRFFRQRLDLYNGRVVIDLGDESHPARLTLWGHPETPVLIVDVEDPNGVLPTASVELSEWRDSMTVTTQENTLCAQEVHSRPARPHMANTGMEGYDPPGDPLKDRATAVKLGTFGVSPISASAKGRTVTLVLPPNRPPRYQVLIVVEVTPSGSKANAVFSARRTFDDLVMARLDRLRQDHQTWWHQWWDRSLLHVTSPDASADRLVRAWHVHLYTLACVNRGAVPAKWDGGPGLMRGDERTWGLAEWVQEIRFTYMPLYAANRLEMARGLSDHYFRMRSYLIEQTRKMWDLPGLWIPETVLPWGHAEDWVLKDDGRGAAGDHFKRWSPATTPHGKFELYNPYVGFLFTAGLEVCHHYLTWWRFSGDENFAAHEAYPMLRGVCEFVAGLLRKGPDARYHLDPANALETWWLVRDPADTLDGIRAIFPEFIRMAERYGRDEPLRVRCTEILAALPDPPRGLWAEDGKIDLAVDAYAPAAAKGVVPNRCNAENPALYRVYPFGLSGIGTADYDRARRTFDHRICSLGNGWSMDPIWAARLGLGDEAVALLTEHARRYHRFRYGGWTSNDSQVFPNRLSSTPFLDAAGLSAFALQECLLQSHNGLIRVIPAIAKDWSGKFMLRAEGGFLVTAAFVSNRTVTSVDIRSLLGRPCAVASPWPGECIVRDGATTVLKNAAGILRFQTQVGRTYILQPVR